MKNHRDAISTRPILRAHGPWAMMLFAFAGTACGSGETSTGGGGGSAGGGGTPQPGMPVCYPHCSTVADCFSEEAGPPFDGDNYACEDGLCIYKGCNDDQECVDMYDPSYGCSVYPGETIKRCNLKCSSVNDCYSGSSPALDGDNWACESGLCVYTGCKITQECVDTYGPLYACSVYPGETVWMCNFKCSTVDDCFSEQSQPAFDGDNYACKNGLCVRTGCNSTQECVDSEWYGPGYICTPAP